MASKRASKRDTLAPTFPYSNLADVRRAHSKHYAGYFFSPDTLRVFGSRVLDSLYGGRYFVTSDRTASGEGRAYTVRHAHPNGDVTTVGEFGEFASASAARSAAQRLADTDPERVTRTIKCGEARDTWDLTARERDGYVIVTATPWERDPARKWNGTGSYRDYVASLGTPSAAQYRRIARLAAPSGSLAMVERGSRYGHPRIYRLTLDTNGASA